jgi:50S ribosomal subunit-associated GTPase HflX
MRISALNPDDVRRLRDKILEHFRSTLEVWEIMLPYAESKLESQLHAHGSVEVSRPLEKGSFYRVRIAGEWAKKLGLQRYKL